MLGFVFRLSLIFGEHGVLDLDIEVEFNNGHGGVCFQSCGEGYPRV